MSISVRLHSYSKIMVMEIIGGAGLLAESLLVMLLCAPMPSNKLRGTVTRWVNDLWNRQFIRYAFAVTSVVNGCNLAMLFYALRQPYYRLGWGFGMPRARGLMEAGAQIELLRNERNAFVSGTSLFVFVVLRRLIKIQMQLHSARTVEKATVEDVGSDEGKGRSTGQTASPHLSRQAQVSQT